MSYIGGCGLSRHGGEKGGRQAMRGPCSIQVRGWRRWLEQGGGCGSGLEWWIWVMFWQQG